MNNKRFCFDLSNYIILCNLVYVYYIIYGVIANSFILRLFDISIAGTINFVIRDLIGIITLIYITYEYSTVVKKNHTQYYKSYKVWSLVILSSYILMTFAIRGLLLVFGDVSIIILFLFIEIETLINFIFGSIYTIKILYGKKIKVIHWIAVTVTIIAAYLIGIQALNLELPMTIQCILFLTIAFYIRNKPI